MAENIFGKTYQVRENDIGIFKKLELISILGFLQDTASDHAKSLGFGYEEMFRSGLFWVLIRQKLKMSYWPALGEEINVYTWTKPVTGIYAIREFQILLNNHIIGNCSTSWMVLDTVKRKPQDLQKVKDKFSPRKDFELDFVAQKLTIPFALEKIGETIVNANDLDQNEHVNNVNYSKWIMDKIPLEFRIKYFPREYDINFLEETHLNDKVLIDSNINRLNTGKEEIFFKGYKTNREKPVFISKMKLEEIKK